jgi:hypothetical protein
MFYNKFNKLDSTADEKHNQAFHNWTIHILVETWQHMQQESSNFSWYMKVVHLLNKQFVLQCR